MTVLENDQSCWGICFHPKSNFSQLNFTAFGRTNSGIHIFVGINCFICNTSGENANRVFIFHLFCAQGVTKPRYFTECITGRDLFVYTLRYTKPVFEKLRNK